MKFLKNRWPELVSFLLIMIVLLMNFVPVFNLVIKTETSSSNISISLFEFIIGSEKFNFGGNVVLFVASILFVIAVVIYFIASFLLKKIKVYKILNYISFPLILIYLFSIIFLFAYAPFLNKGIIDIQNFDEIKIISWSYSIIVFAIVFFALLDLRRTFENKHFTIYEISEIAILCALGLILDKVKIPVGSTGGSINASMVPLMIISIRHGAIKGLISSSIIFGFVSCLLDGYGFQTYPFDYFIAFSGYASAGLFYYLFTKFSLPKKENKEGFEFIYIMSSIFLGSIITFITRMGGHSLSSIVLYGYSLKDALIYNLTYVPISVFGSMFIALFLAKPIQVINQRFSLKKNKNL